MKFLADAVVADLRQQLAAEEEPDLSGTPYQLRAAIGEGGMGAVYVVHDERLGRDVALKIVSGPHADKLAERLRYEARVIARLEHPGIVPVHDLGHLADGRLYYVMKLVRGQQLDEWAATKPPRPAMLRFFQRICEAMAFAHAHDVIHRDLKPANIMVGEFGEALVLDWGLAKDIGSGAPAFSADGPSSHAATSDAGAVDETADTVLDDQFADTVTLADGDATAQGTVMGTPAYMPPEQARGDIDALDQRSDVYALGAILYFLLVGRPPHDAASMRAILADVIEREPEALRSLDDTIARPLASICQRAMAKRQGDRYATALELAEDIGHFLDGASVSAHRETVVEIALRVANNNRGVIALLLVYLTVRVAMALLVPG